MGFWQVGKLQDWGGEKVERIQDLEVRRLRSSKIGKLKGQCERKENRRENAREGEAERERE